MYTFRFEAQLSSDVPIPDCTFDESFTPCDALGPSGTGVLTAGDICLHHGNIIAAVTVPGATGRAVVFQIGIVTSTDYNTAGSTYAAGDFRAAFIDPSDNTVSWGRGGI